MLDGKVSSQNSKALGLSFKTQQSQNPRASLVVRLIARTSGQFQMKVGSVRALFASGSSELGSSGILL